MRDEEVIEYANRVFKMQQARYREIGRRSVNDRKQDLKRLLKVVLSHREEIASAVAKDLNKPAFESDFSEVYPVVSELRHAIKHLHRWASTRKVPAPVAMIGTKAWMKPEAKGQALVVSPWNFPFNLSLGPVISAIAAGCSVILKPSESTPASGALMKEILGEVFEEDHVAVVNGEVAVSIHLTNLPFHHVFFTGGPEIGKHVMGAAAKNLASVTLELGGKSPAVVDHRTNLDDTISRLIHGKLLNNGQACVAVDYILVDEKIKGELVNGLRSALGKYYPDPMNNGDLSSLIHERHFDHMLRLLEDAKTKGALIEDGGVHERNRLRFSPTILTNVTEDMLIMQEEIFGPLLPILSYRTKEEALEIIHRNPRALSFYVFSKSKEFAKFFFDQSLAGSSAWNETYVQFGHINLPFGGLNQSGIGKGHGEFGFNEFSNLRSFVKQRWKWNATKLVQPPYGKRAQWLIDLMIRRF
ncbi:aldehyde dehydrogenase family protein [Sanyastnella coralliicola]|uniref:aldehyde dehydrogenase family protein n=1 Tax=Sanyastnella coralliicola TaxID=3069118 RepID=UPI0027B99EAA|nr:aldehyde dehydrogenase family protein [Longitalea sp. SCSIO 12813]